MALVVNEEADMAIDDFMMTLVRYSAVDFTIPLFLSRYLAHGRGMREAKRAFAYPGFRKYHIYEYQQKFRGGKGRRKYT